MQQSRPGEEASDEALIELLGRCAPAAQQFAPTGQQSAIVDLRRARSFAATAVEAMFQVLQVDIRCADALFRQRLDQGYPSAW
ncbi:MAG: hypothetical protein R3F12_01805 [Lysobacteraceae bacterium]|nr:hypothetical protein [Xanthomonadaceae bacterium]